MTAGTAFCIIPAPQPPVERWGCNQGRGGGILDVVQRQGDTCNPHVLLMSYYLSRLLLQKTKQQQKQGVSKTSRQIGPSP